MSVIDFFTVTARNLSRDVGENVTQSVVRSGYDVSLVVQSFNPLQGIAWQHLIAEHRRATVFHDIRWLQALRLTYGYTPVAFTTSDPSESLANGWVFCVVDSWLTGSRLVSLPFSDHCDPLISSHEELEALIEYLQQRQKHANPWRYIEARPLTVNFTSSRFRPVDSYVAQRLSLAPSTQELFAGFHRDSIRRKIRRAHRDGVLVQEGHSEALLEQFYFLQSMTRRRHRLPPQPERWFRNLLDFFGESCTIYVASLHSQPVASILTLRFRKTLVYKYGASDARFHASGAVPLLLWIIVQRAKDQGLQELDLGRSDLNNQGLMKFKERLGAERVPMRYFRQGSQPELLCAAFSRKVAAKLCAYLPSCIRDTAGSILYRHGG